MIEQLRTTPWRRVAEPPSPEDGRGLCARCAVPGTEEQALAWDSEVLVVCGEDVAQLRRRAESLAAWVRARPGISLKDLAFTLNTDLPAGGCRLAVVAETAEALHARLARAAERLADPKCRQINDAQGIYYATEPLYLQGKLAVLFPGEGAQYLNMLADVLRHFPEAHAHFDACDAAALAVGRREGPVSRAVFVPHDLPDQERAAAEQALWRLGNAVSSVLIVDWALYLVLRNLGVRPDAVAGHSSGEVTALAAAGCLEANDLLYRQLAALGEALQVQEDAGDVADAVLLAAGTGRARAEAAIAEAGAEVLLAMDNCPHQTVLAGPPEAVSAVEAVLRARGVVCERLPFRRPYHTPLFEPSLGPIARTYDALSFRAPRLPVYSCVTACPFPDDAAAVRSLAVAHWASRVEFTRLIEAMYADGVRLFLECGPRGNLTAFVADILRGKPAAAIAANVQRRSGIAQLNHMAAQLAVQQVPLDLRHFYSRRQPRRVEWEAVPLARSAGKSSPHRPFKPAADALTGYLDVMDQFLDVQRDVLEHYLSRSRATEAHRTSRAEDAVRSTQYAGPRPDPSGAEQRFPLLGDIVHHLPGQELVLRRTMDLAEDLYALDHTLGGRHASAFDPDLHGLPVMPMALSLEMMAEAAAVLVPGRILVGMDGVRLHRWIPFDDEPVVLEVVARRLSTNEHGWEQLRVELRDHGNATRPGNPQAASVEGTVLFADVYPVPPPVDDFPLSHERPPCFTPAQLYDEERRMFHGPTFQSVCATDRCGDEGIEGHLLARPPAGLFRSDPEPRLLTDPLLIDASTHLLGCWHLGQPDPSGRVVLPYELGTVRFFGPPPAAGSRVRCRVRVERETSRQASHRIDLIGPGGRLWCRLHPAEYWRFYWPQAFVDYFRLKASFLLGERWEAAEQKTGRGLAHCFRLTPPADLTSPIMRAVVAHVSLSRAEWREFRAMQGPEEQLTEWVYGRLIAKDAVRSLWHAWHGERLLPADIELVPNADGGLVARWLGGRRMPAVSVSHADGLVAALAAFTEQVGLEIEKVGLSDSDSENGAYVEGDRALLDGWDGVREEAVARLRCARRAVAKALGEGSHDLTVRALMADGTVRVALGPHSADGQMIAHTVRDGEFVVAATFGERTQE